MTNTRLQMDHDHRSRAWLAWMGDVRTKLLATPFGDAPETVRAFFLHQWTMHSPAVFAVAPMPAMQWTLAYLRDLAGDLPVQVQAGRASDPDFELHKERHRTTMLFSQFLDAVESGPANDVYLTANNTAANGALMRRLAPDLQPLPDMLRPDPQAGFLWMGAGSRTPCHIDQTCNLLIQLVGERIVYLIPPSEQPRLENDTHVFSRLRHIEDIRARGLAHTEVRLTPGDALFIPVGWWHAVDSLGLSVMASYTNFHWENNWTGGYPG